MPYVHGNSDETIGTLPPFDAGRRAKHFRNYWRPPYVCRHSPAPLIGTSLFASHCHSQAMAGFPVMRPRRPAAPPDRYRDVFDDPAGDHGWRRVHRMMIGSVSCLCCLMQRQRCPRATASLLPPRCFVRFVTESRAFVVGCNLQASEVSGRFGAREKQGDQIILDSVETGYYLLYYIKKFAECASIRVAATTRTRAVCQVFINAELSDIMSERIKFLIIDMVPSPSVYLNRL